MNLLIQFFSLSKNCQDTFLYIFRFSFPACKAISPVNNIFSLTFPYKHLVKHISHVAAPSCIFKTCNPL